MALDAEGKILALRIARSPTSAPTPPAPAWLIQLLIGPWVQTSVYDIQTIDFHFQAVLTNTAPTGAYRGAGRPEAIFTIERLMDEAARQTGIDRIELRRRNFIRPEQMPYKNPMGADLRRRQLREDHGPGAGARRLEGFEARAAQSARNGKHRGLGIATFLEWTGGNVLEERVTVSKCRPTA
jgi:carbon-monoxide dehydrogenase large subunit